MALTLVGDAMLIEYHDFRHTDTPPSFFDPNNIEKIGSYPWKKLRKYSSEQLHLYESKLLHLYDSAADEFYHTISLSREFAETYLKINHPLFMGYLKELAPNFLAALEPYWSEIKKQK